MWVQSAQLLPHVNGTLVTRHWVGLLIAITHYTRFQILVAINVVYLVDRQLKGIVEHARQ